MVGDTIPQALELGESASHLFQIYFPVVRMEDRIGNFEVGKEFDALLVDTEATGTPLDIFLEVSLNRFM